MSCKLVCFVVVATTTALADPERPSLPQQWIAIEADDIELNQGGVKDDGKLCCAPDSPQCKIQTAHQTAKFHFDFPNNRTRTGDIGEEGAIVSLYAPVRKEMKVSANNTCLEYCPLQFDLDPFGLDPNATYVGRTTFQGKDVDEWTWTEYVFKKWHLLPLQKTNFFVSLDKPPVPVRENDIIEPLGQQLGTENNTWSQFKPGAPPAAAFAVTNVENCKMSPNCQSSDREGHRLRARDLKNTVLYRFPQFFIGKMHMEQEDAKIVV